MAARRRNNKMSPYEVMRAGLMESRQPANPDDETTPIPDPTTAPTHTTHAKPIPPHTPPTPPNPTPRPAAGQWWLRAQAPIVLRVPRGYAVLLGLAYVGVIILAYWAGHRRGTSHPSPDQPPTVNAAQPGAGLATYGPDNDPVRRWRNDSQPGSGGGVAPTRQAGFNYFVLAHYPEEDAQQLVNYLWQEGIEAAAYKRQPDSRLFQVIALRGFTKDQLNGPQRQAFERQLHKIGRDWRAAELGPDFAKSGMYPDLYEGEPVAETLFQREQP